MALQALLGLDPTYLLWLAESYLLFNASENKSNISFENFDVSIGSGKTNK